MPSPLPGSISREYRIYLALWRKAYVTDTEIELTASNFALALNMRQGFYRAIKPYREGTLLDDVLSKASESFVVSVVKGPDKSAPHKVTLKPRKSLSELEAEILKLGLTEADLLLDAEHKTLSALDEFTSPTLASNPDAASPGLPRRSTPFYER